MEALALILILIIIAVAAIILYPLWKRSSSCTPCTTTTTTGSTCFPSTTFPVKSGLIDLRNCTDHVYILGDQTRVHFLTEA